MIFSSFSIQKLLDQAQVDQPLVSGNYSNLARIAKTDLAVNRPNGPISKNPLIRYIELREAMEFLRSPSNHAGFSQKQWNITWSEMLSGAIPDDEIEVFCSLLFASSLLSVVRYWYGVDAVKNFSGPPIRDQWTPDLHNSQEFQGNYYAAVNCGVRFSGDLESTIKPVYGILSTAYSVISPHCLPTSILDGHFHGDRSNPRNYFISDKYTDVFRQGLEIFIAECRKQLFELSPEGQEKGGLLMNLLCLEASRRYHVTF